VARGNNNAFRNLLFGSFAYFSSYEYAENIFARAKSLFFVLPRAVELDGPMA
jgi:hypothetical protein